jgi:hypothetical protein
VLVYGLLMAADIYLLAKFARGQAGTVPGEAEGLLSYSPAE